MAGGKKKRKGGGGGGGATPSPARPPAVEAEAVTPGAAEAESPFAAEAPSLGAAEAESPCAVEAPSPCTPAEASSTALGQAESPRATADERELPVPFTPLEERAAADVPIAAAVHAALRPEEEDGRAHSAAEAGVHQPRPASPASPPPPAAPPANLAASPSAGQEAAPDFSPPPRAQAGLRRTSTGSFPSDGGAAALAAAQADAAAARAELAEVRAEYDAFRASTAEVCAQLQVREEEAAAARSRLAEASAAADSRLARAEAALERERERARALADAAAAERATADALRAQLASADADAALARADLGALRAELGRLRDAAAMEQRSAELRGAADEAVDAQREPPAQLARDTASSEEVAELRGRAEAATALIEKLVADNDTLTELVNEQAQILNAIRAARLSAQQPARAPTREAHVSEDEDVEDVERSSTPEQAHPAGDDDGGAGAPHVASGPASPSSARADGPLDAEPAEAPRVATPPPAKPQRWVLGRVWAHIAGYDDVPPRERRV